ncbi:aminodeoxychorismate lyase [Lysobacter humi (ex Lee et al. 2017)]
MSRLFLGDSPLDTIPFDDRGRAYGDGLFETMRAVDGDVPWWDAHWRRLAHGAVRLGIALPDAALARRTAVDLLDGGGGALKLLLTRGPAQRGYAPSDAAPLWSLAVHEAPAVGGTLSLRWCTTRLAPQPVLAGLKHCNRLEQVLARREWTADDDADEGLLCDIDGRVVCAVAANVFVLHEDRWLTPVLDRCGVRGVCRDWVLAEVGASEAELRPDDIESADAVFLCNALRGILEVARLGERSWTPHPRVAKLRDRLAAAHPAFRPESP